MVPFLAILYLKDPLQRDFYAEMCRIERWSTQTLQERIQSMLYERIVLSKKPAKLIEQELEPRGIHVAEYLTELPSRELLQQRLHDAVVRNPPAPGAASGFVGRAASRNTS